MILLFQMKLLVSFMKRHFPEAKLHGSTQMAIHNPGGARFALEQGLCRVVLARETEVQAVKEIREGVPDLELEVFVHGAYCYGFSGLCQASHALTGRSANRGQCTQVCRTWFEGEGGPAYFFSAADLERGSELKKWLNAGVHSLKIEGRMKSPDYARASVEYYKSLLDSQPSEIIEEKKKTLSRIFSRPYQEKTKTTPLDPGPRGEKAAKVLKKQGSGYILEAYFSLEPRDGLLALEKGKGISSRKVISTRLSPRGHLLTNEELEPGTILYRISNTKDKKNYPKAESFLPWKKKVDLEMDWEKGIFKVGTPQNTFSYPLEHLLEGQRGNMKKALAKQFSSSGVPDYTLGALSLGKGLQEESFIPPSSLKVIRRQFYEDLYAFKRSQGERLKKSIGPLTVSQEETNFFRRRGDFVDPRNSLPFFLDWEDLDIKTLKSWNAYIPIPLSPLVFQEEKYYQGLGEFIAANPQKKFLLGLNNPGNLNWVLNNPELPVSLYLDWGLPCTNSWSWDLFKKLLGDRLLLVLPFFEEPSNSKKTHPPWLPLYAPNIALSLLKKYFSKEKINIAWSLVIV